MASFSKVSCEMDHSADPQKDAAHLRAAVSIAVGTASPQTALYRPAAPVTFVCGLRGQRFGGTKRH